MSRRWAVGFGAGQFTEPGGLEATLVDLLDDIDPSRGCGARGISDRPFPSAAQRVASSVGRRVVVLVDEYDKPILDRARRA